MGSLAPTRTLRIPMALMLDDLKTNRSGEYNAKDLTNRVTGPVVASAVDAYIRYSKGKRAIFFGIHRDHSRRVCEGLRNAGFRAEHVDGDDPPARRDRIMNEFRTGGIDIVGNCDLISEGFDAPACEVIMMGAPTRSVTRYLQQAGRAMRPGVGKTALVLDLAGISHELGLPDEVREWDLADGEIQATQESPRCATRMPAMPYGFLRACLPDVRIRGAASGNTAGGNGTGRSQGAGSRDETGQPAQRFVAGFGDSEEVKKPGTGGVRTGAAQGISSQVGQHIYFALGLCKEDFSMTQSKIYELADQHEHDEWTDTYTHECGTAGEYEPCYSCEDVRVRPVRRLRRISNGYGVGTMAKDNGGPAFPRPMSVGPDGLCATLRMKACSCAIISRGWQCRGSYPIRKCR